MNIYTKNGDRGTTELVNAKNVSKSDDRIQLLGTIDELTSHIGLVKTISNHSSVSWDLNVEFKFVLLLDITIKYI